MPSRVLESDWKRFRKLYDLALERFCQRVIESLDRLSRDDSRSHYERYTEINSWLRHQNKQFNELFSDYSRSAMLFQLMAFVGQGLVELDELEGFSQHVRETVEGVVGPKLRRPKRRS